MKTEKKETEKKETETIKMDKGGEWVEVNRRVIRAFLLEELEELNDIAGQPHQSESRIFGVGGVLAGVCDVLTGDREIGGRIFELLESSVEELISKVKQRERQQEVGE